MGSGAATARDTLHQAVAGAYKHTLAAGKALAQGIRAAVAEPDLERYYVETVRVIMALDQLAASAQAAAKDVRTALQASLQDTGCPQVTSEQFTAYLAREPAWVEIVDPKQIPPDLWKRPEAEPDKRRIKEAIEQGRIILGASINMRNSQRLVIRPKQ
jgi:hypothetical protein